MAVDLDFVAKIVSPVIVSIVGALLKKYTEAKPRVITYLTHASAVKFNGEDDNLINTHCIVVANIGKKTAHNLRIGHFNLPKGFQIYPPVAYSLLQTPAGTSEILIPTLVQGEQIFVTYMYDSPMVFHNINAYTKSDEGSASVIKVIPRPQPPKSILVMVIILMFIGASALLYWAIIFIGRFA